MKNKIVLFIVIILSITLGVLAYQHRGTVKKELLIANTNIQSAKATIIPQPTQMLASGIPNYHLIRTAFIPQAPDKNWDQPWQDACEEASLLTFYYYYQNQTPTIAQIKAKIIDMISYEDKQGWGTSINTTQIKQIADSYLGYSSEIISNPTIEDLKKYVSQNIPVLVPAAGKILFAENKFFNEGGPLYHALVIVGYDDTQQKFIVHDVGTQHGAYFRYSYDLLMTSIHDLPPSGNINDILQGDKKVLIIRNK